MDKILLIYPPTDSYYYVKGVNDSPPLGLVVLHNYIRKRLPHLIIDIIDGEHNSLENIEEIIKKGNYDLVGIQPMMASYFNTLKIATWAKEVNSKVVFGGHHATQLATEIISNKFDVVDFIIVGDGEEALLGLVNNSPIEKIPNLVYWDSRNKSAKRTFLKNCDIEDGKIDFFPEELLGQYINNSKLLERGNNLSYRSYSHKGCNNRMNSSYCYFCGRADKGYRYKEPETYIDELKYLSFDKNAAYIFEIGDDFLQNEEWLQKVVELKRNKLKNFDTHLKVFARANRINQKVIDLLKELNVDEVAIGFESGSDKILNNIAKGITVQENLDAAELLFKNQIDTIASFVIGLPGEDNISLSQTYDAAQRMVDFSLKYLNRKPQEVIGNMLEVNPGSPAFKELKRKSSLRYDGDEYTIDGVQNDYFRMKFGLSSIDDVKAFRAHLTSWCHKINSLGKYTYPAGLLKDEIIDVN